MFFSQPPARSSSARERYLKLSELEVSDSPESESATSDGGETFETVSSSSSSSSDLWFGYNLKGLQPQTKYAVRVQTQNKAGWSPESAHFVFSTSHIGELEFWSSEGIEC